MSDHDTDAGVAWMTDAANDGEEATSGTAARDARISSQVAGAPWDESIVGVSGSATLVRALRQRDNLRWCARLRG